MNIVCVRCTTSFSDEQWEQGEVSLYAERREWVCANCQVEIVTEWLESDTDREP